MMTRTFGPDAMPLPILGLGCSRIGSFSNPATPAASRRLLDHALSLGVSLLDTADIYGQGDSERAIGRVLRGRRDRGFVVSKVGKRFSAPMRLLRPLKPILKPLLAGRKAVRTGITARRDGAMASDFSPAYLRGAIDRTLRRLGIDTLDALLLHSPDAAELADPAVVETLVAARQAGKIRFFGVACDDLDSLCMAVSLPGLSLIEIPPDVFEAGRPLILDAVADRNLGVLVREVIRFRGDLSPLGAVRAMAGRIGVTSVIAGTGSMAHLDDLVRALAAVEAGLGREQHLPPWPDQDPAVFGRRVRAS